MKKFKLLISCLLIFQSAYISAALPDWGRADTLEHYSVGPGAIYTKIQFPEYPLYIYVTEIDLMNEYTKIEQIQSNGIVPDAKRETTLNQSIRNTSKGHRVYCATNHDFFTFNTNICIGMNANAGEVPYSTGWGRSMLAFAEDKTASVFFPKPSTSVKLADNSTVVSIDVYNTNPDDGYQGVLYNKYNARTISGDGVFIKIQAQGEWSFNGPDIPCKVLEVSNTPIQSTKTEYVLHFRGAKATQVNGKVKANDVISISQKFLKGKFGDPGENIKTAFHGYPSIAYEGKLHDGEYNNFENGREYEISARTMLGMSKDGKKAYVMVVDGRSAYSKGINCIEMAEYMLNMGAWNVVNFDSGGSSTMIINNETVSKPSDGVQRYVMDSFQAVSTAPESNEVTSYTFSRPSITPLRNAKTVLSIFAHNKYGEILEKDVEGFTYKCYPESLGTIDANGVFVASNNEEGGYIEAEKNGFKTQIRVNVQPVGKIQFSLHNALIDNIDPVKFDVAGILNERSQELDVSALTWINSNPEVCAIENGIVKGLKNGTAQIIGQLDNLADTLNVNVEIGVDSISIDNFNDKPSFIFKHSDVISNVTNTDTDLPVGWADGMTISMSLKSGRLPYLEMNKNISIYGIPDSLTVQLRASSNSLRNIIFYLKGTSGTTWNLTTNDYDLSKDNIITLVANKKHNANFSIPASEYPLTLYSVRFNVQSMTSPAEKIWIRDLRAYYPNKSVGNSIEIDEMNNFEYNLNFNGNVAELEYTLSENATVAMSLYKINGVKVIDWASNYKLAGEHTETIGLGTLGQGVYIIQLTVNGQSKAIKFVR